MYFADHGGELGVAVRAGRADFMKQFRSAATQPLVEALPDPRDPETFARCQLDHGERARHRQIVDLHRDLLRLRQEAVRSLSNGSSLDGAVLSDHAFVLRWFSNESDRLLVVNLGSELMVTVVPEPLLAPPTPLGWRILWSSEDAAYGGAGTAAVETPTTGGFPARRRCFLAPSEV